MYNENNLSQLRKKKLISILIIVLSVIAFASLFVIFYLTATRDNKTTSKIIGSILIIASLFSLIFGISYLMYALKTINQFVQIMNETGESVSCLFVSRKDYTVTLQGGASAHELTFNVNGNDRIYYLDSLFDYHFEKFHVNLIATDLTSQFMTHISTSIYLALLGASPYILYELFGFVSPALYDNEKKYSVKVLITVYLLFIIGLLMSYYVIFPIAFRFLGTYSVDARVVSNITLDSYIDTFITLALVLGFVFQLPVIAFVLAKLGIVNAKMLSNYRRHALLVIGFLAAMITPPDLLSLIMVTVPLYLLYEISIRVVRFVKKTSSSDNQ